MIRFRATVRNGRTQLIPVFDNAEALFVWLDDNQSGFDDTKVIELLADDFIDVEWLGCEVVNLNNAHKYLDLVNIAYAKMPENGSNHVVEYFHGWTTIEMLPRTTTESLTIRTLNDDEGLRAPYPFE